MKGSNLEPADIPSWQELPAGCAGVPPTPYYELDRPRRAWVEGVAVRALSTPPLRPRVLASPVTPWPECLPFPLVGSRAAAERLAAGGTPRSLVLGVAPPHHPGWPDLADPYDGTAFEVALLLRPVIDALYLLSGLPGDAPTPRGWSSRLFELGRFAYELRRATGLDPRGLVLAGGVGAGGWPGRPPEAARLETAWARVGGAVAGMTSDWGLAFEEVWVDLGEPGTRLAVRLVTTVVAESGGIDPVALCDAPAAALQEVEASRRSGVARVRMGARAEPQAARLPLVAIPPGPVPRRLALQVRRTIPGLPWRDLPTASGALA